MSSNQTTIFIVSASPVRFDAIKQLITLRNIESIQSVLFSNALGHIQQHPECLVIVDAVEHQTEARALLKKMPEDAITLVLADQFDEEFFIDCHDHGVQEFLIYPVPGAYLMSKIFSSLEQRRLLHQLTQQKQTLTQLGAISKRSGVYTTTHLLNVLQQHTQHLQSNPGQALSIAVVQFSGHQQPLSPAEERSIYTYVVGTIQQSCRSQDLIGEYLEDKLLVVMPGTPIAGAQSLATRIQQQNNVSTLPMDKGLVKLNIQVGVADYTGCHHYEALINKACQNLTTRQPNPA